MVTTSQRRKFWPGEYRSISTLGGVPLTARDHHGSLRERPVGLREIFEGEIAAIAGVHIKHSETRAFPGQDAYVGVWPCRPPLANLGRVDARGVQPVDDTGMLS